MLPCPCISLVRRALRYHRLFQHLERRDTMSSPVAIPELIELTEGNDWCASCSRYASEDKKRYIRRRRGQRNPYLRDGKDAQTCYVYRPTGKTIRQRRTAAGPANAPPPVRVCNRAPYARSFGTCQKRSFGKAMAAHLLTPWKTIYIVTVKLQNRRRVRQSELI